MAGTIEKFASELSEAVEEIRKEHKTKIAEFKVELDEVEGQFEKKIFEILTQTKRDRFMCRLMGYKTEKQKVKDILRKKRRR